MKRTITIILFVITVISLSFLAKIGLQYITDNDKNTKQNNEIKETQKKILDIDKKINEAKELLEKTTEEKNKLIDEKKDEVEVLELWEESLKKIETYLQ